MSKSKMSKRFTTWAAVAVVSVAGVGVGYALGAFDASQRFGGRAIAEERALPASADTYTMSRQPEVNSGTRSVLYTGSSGSAGVMVSYLSFDIAGADAGSPLTLRLPIADLAKTESVEVAQVGRQWSETELAAGNIPASGAVLASATVEPGDQIVQFELPAVAAGSVSYAVTTPSSTETIEFHSRESAVAVPRLVVGESTGTPPPVVDAAKQCELGPKLVPSCGLLNGVAPGSHSDVSGKVALREFEDLVGPQRIYHAYHRGEREMFPTKTEIQVASDPKQPRLLMLNWKPRSASWAQIAAGDPRTDAYLDELAGYIDSHFDRPFFFTVHHEPENDVDQNPGSGYTAADYAAMFRHVVERLRDGGADKLVSVMVYMAYLKWTAKSWHSQLYPGDDVVDWVSWDVYGHSKPGGGYGDFAELVNRVGDQNSDWPGFYRWAAAEFPDKPLMIAEWGVWLSDRNIGHQAEVFKIAAAQLALFPRLKALVYFESADAEGRDSRVDTMPDSLDAFRRLMSSPLFEVQMPPVPEVA